ncbi:MAG: DUF3040 domain-containing protein [Nocardioides sp.]|uniref:DUF3040 domain-containing protein n=1 Tax=Nocardioides sp. TaxID=35761 RepID=UPI0039E4D29B
MPLSEEELRLLEQMERALVRDDPKLASTLRGTAMRRAARRRVVVAVLGFVIGVAVLMSGAILRMTVVGILGFVVMLATATVAVSSWHGGSTEGGDPAPRVSLRDRLEERWRRHHDDHDS